MGTAELAVALITGITGQEGSYLAEFLLKPQWLGGRSRARVVAESPSTASALRRYRIEPEAVITPGCAPSHMTRIPLTRSTTPPLLWIGRLVRTKRPEDAIVAFQKIPAVIPGASMDLVGAGYLERQIRARNLSSLTVYGFVDDSVTEDLLDPGALHQAAMALLTNEVRRRRMAQLAYECAQGLTWERPGRDLLGVLERPLARDGMG